MNNNHTLNKPCNSPINNPEVLLILFNTGSLLIISSRILIIHRHTIIITNVISDYIDENFTNAKDIGSEDENMFESR